MNDIEFALHVSAPIGQLYREAKHSRRQFPRNTLIAARSLASMCCDMLRRHDAVDWPTGLGEKIRTLDGTRRINRATRDHLDQLRRWGNAAAHPEDSLFGEARQKVEADRALTSAIALLETVFQEHHRGAAVPSYEIVDEGEDELREACYRALVENNPADQHQVGVLLLARLEARIAELRAAPDPAQQMYLLQWEFQGQEDRALELLRYASDAGHAPSRYQYGLALTNGARGKDQVSRGAYLIAMACRDGDINALAWCGRSALLGLFDEPVDYALARGYLQRAADEDHPMALSLLSAIHRDGLGVEPDAAKAFALTLRAAEAGYAAAQYDTAVALTDGSGVKTNDQEALKWMRRASDAGLPQAMFARAKSLLEYRTPAEEADIEALLICAADHINEAHMDLAEMYMSWPDPQKWREAAVRIQTAYEVALGKDDSALAQRCLAAGPLIIAKLEAAISTMPDDLLKDVVDTRFLFDEKGLPHPSRAARVERMRDLMRRLVVVRGTGSNEELSLQREIASIKTPQAARRLASVRAPGRNTLCPCGSGKKYKHCHA